MHFLLHFSLYILLGVHTTSAQTSVTVNAATVKLGGDATIKCIIEFESGDSVSVLSWHEADSSGNRVGDLLVSRTSLVNGRYSLSNNKDLTISNAEVDDKGYYRCSIATANSEFADGFSNLTVYYLNSPVLTSDKSSIKINDTVTLDCSMPDGVPEPISITTWLKEDSKINTSATEKYLKTDTTLVINLFDENDEGSYQCRAENSEYSGTEGKLSNELILSLSGGGGGGDDNGNGSGGLSGGAIAGIVVGILILAGVIIIFGVICFLQKNKKGNGIKSVTGTSEIEGLTDEVTYSQVSKPGSNNGKAPPKPERANSGKNPSDKSKANVESLTYAELDLNSGNDGKNKQIIRTEPETEYSSVRTVNKQ